LEIDNPAEKFRNFSRFSVYVDRFLPLPGVALDFHLSAHKKGINGWRFKTTSGLLLKVEEFERQYLQLNVSVPISEGWKKKSHWPGTAFLPFFFSFRLFFFGCSSQNVP